MNHLPLTLGALTLGGSAAVLLLAWAGRSTRSRRSEEHTSELQSQR